MLPFDSEKQLFTANRKKWLEVCETDHFIPEDPSVTELENGVLLPLRVKKDVKVRNSVFEGGCCDSEGNFVGGLLRNTEIKNANLNCASAYPLPETIAERHETVIFGGVLLGHFGHSIIDSLGRLWWFVEHPDTPYKLVFLRAPAFMAFDDRKVLETVGIPRERMEIITEPTRFDKIIVPEESFHMFSSYTRKIDLVYDRIRDQTPQGPYKKVYLSRSGLSEDKRMVNEEYFENFYARRGYAIIHPEQLPFLEQVSIMHGADEVVSTNGSLVLQLLFCKPRTKGVVLCRTRDVTQGMIIPLFGRDIDVSIVDISNNFLGGVYQTTSVHFCGPTVYWRQYLDKANIAYEEDEVSLDKHLKPYFYEYVCQWGRKNATPHSFRDVHNRTMVDIVSNINEMFLDGSVNRSELPDRDDVVKAKRERDGIARENKTYQKLLAGYDQAKVDLALSNKELARQQNELTKQTGMVEQLSRQNDEARQRIDDLRVENGTLQERNEELLRGCGGLQERNEELLRNCGGLQERNEELLRRCGGLQEKNDELMAALGEREKRLSELREAMELARKEKASQKKENAKLKKQLQWMQNTRSWRVTKPLRAITRSFRSLFGKA